MNKKEAIFEALKERYLIAYNGCNNKPVTVTYSGAWVTVTGDYFPSKVRLAKFEKMCETLEKRLESKVKFTVNQIVMTPDGKAQIVLVDNNAKSVRVKHLEAKTPVTDYYFKDLKAI